MRYFQFKYLLLVVFTLNTIVVHSQIDTVYRQHRDYKADSLFTQEFSKEMSEAISDPVFYLLKSIAPVFNIGISYAHLIPTSGFTAYTQSRPGLSVDIAMNLTAFWGNMGNNFQLYGGSKFTFMNLSSRNLSDMTYVSGDTTITYSLKNALELWHFYLEFEYNFNHVSPFVTLSYAQLHLDPYLSFTQKIKNGFTNEEYGYGRFLDNISTWSVAPAVGVKYKYRFNSHKALMAVLICSYNRFASGNFLDITTATVNNTNKLSYSTRQVAPVFWLIDAGIKYNF